MKPLALIVDDNLRVREAVEDHVAEFDHDFHSVGSQSEACKYLDLHTYDYILLDLELPARSGKPPRAEVGRERNDELEALIWRIVSAAIFLATPINVPPHVAKWLDSAHETRRPRIHPLHYHPA